MPGNMYSAKSQSVIRWKSVTIYIKSIAAPEKFSSPDSNVSLIRAISKAMEMIHAGTFGENQRNSYFSGTGMATWRRSVPSPSLERLINWRLYKEFSKD